MDFIKEIKQLKKEKNAIILAHCYQNAEIDEVADYVGDSLYLSQMAAKTNANIIVFAGVYFMAETAKILSPDKKVLLPNKNAGCQMADMINLQQLRKFKQENPNLPVVCYINSTAEVKSESDICCTSSNAIKIVKSLNVDKVLFAPDTYLGTWVQNQLKNIEIITYNGYCPTHLQITVDDVLKMKEKYPQAKVLAHPECHHDVIKLADFVGSTTQIMDQTKKIHADKFIIVTEKGVVDRLQRDDKKKEYILISPKAICPSMKCIHLQDIYNSLKNETFEINVDKTIAQKAIKSINAMLEASL